MESSNFKASINTAIAANWCYTDVKMTTFNYLWIIKDFSRLCGSGSGTVSSAIFTHSNKKCDYQLELSSKDCNSDFCLCLKQLRGCSQEAVISFYLSNAKCESIQTFGNKYQHLENNSKIQAVVNRKYLFNESGALLHVDPLAVLCKIDMVDGNTNTFGKSIISNLTGPQLSDDLRNLYENGLFSDVILVVGDREMLAHKALLAARSVVFAAKFDHQLDEAETKRVVIDDVDPDVLQEMLRIIYSNESPKLEEMAKDLLAAADKYGLGQLVHMCELALGRDIKVEEAVENLVLADQHNAVHLKAQLIEFINLNASRVLETPGWIHLITNHFKLIEELYKANI